MFAVVRTGGKQYRVAEGDKIAVEKLAGEAGETIVLVAEGDGLRDLAVRDLAGLLGPGDRLVLNNTPVIPARLFGTRTRGEAVARVEVTLLEPAAAGGWRALAKPLRKVKEGETTNDLFAFLTTEANGEVGAVHPKAMPVILTASDEVEQWLAAPREEALQLQRPLPDGLLKIVARGGKEDG